MGRELRELHTWNNFYWWGNSDIHGTVFTKPLEREPKNSEF